MHWAFINESIARKRLGRRGDQVGVYVVGIDEPNNAAAVVQRIDALFANSLAETLTETEKAFQLSFVSMSEAILVAMQAVSLIIVVIIMAVMANTMTHDRARAAGRIRHAEGAGLSAGLRGAAAVRRKPADRAASAAWPGMAADLPLAAAFAKSAGTLFPVFQVSDLTMALQLAGSSSWAWSPPPGRPGRWAASTSSTACATWDEATVKADSVCPTSPATSGCGASPRC
jgi:putative ABC transport system permease protein